MPNLPRSLNWFIAGTMIVLVVPIIKVLVEYQTFMHPWRPELAASLLLIVVLTVVGRSSQFRSFFAEMPRAEFRLIIIPCLLFILWSGLSAIWATSAVFALYHTSVWISYLAFYCFFRYFTRDEGAMARWITGLMLFLWVICLPPLIEYYANVATGNFTSIVARYSKYTEIANTVVPLVAAFAIRSKGRASYFGYVTVGLVLLFDLAAMSRTGIGMFGITTVAMLAVTFTVASLKPYRVKTAALAAALGVLTIVSYGASVAIVGSLPAVDRAVSPFSTVSNHMRGFFYNIALEMWMAAPVVGVGANNYGLVFPMYRQRYAARVPEDAALAFADEALAERTHNEYLQILAELGTAGLAIFGLFLAGIIYCACHLWRDRSSITLETAAALIGVGAFLSSSSVSSYSFRIFQNGLVFFLVLGIAVGGTIGRSGVQDKLPALNIRKRWVKLAIVVAMASSLGLAAYCLTRVVAVHEALAALRSEDPSERERHFSNSLRLDPENATTYRSAGLTRLGENDKLAAKLLRQAIDRGLGTTTEYSYLATALLLSGDLQAASATIDEALLQYPRTAFLHVRSGVLLNMLGRPDEAERHFRLANELDAGQAATWRVFLESGAVKASRFAFETNGVALMDLLPRNAVYAVQKERELRFPEEKFTVPQ